MKYFKILLCFLLVALLFCSCLITANANGTYKTLNKNPEYHYGIDVSQWNGDLDWSALRKKGIEFAYIRVGYFNQYGGYLDSRFEQNVKGCVENGIEFGVYVYSYVYKTEDNIKCAKWVHKQLKKLGNYCKDKDTIQVAYDIEDNVQIKALESGRISNKYIQNSVSAFCDTIREYGYIPTVYSFTHFFNDYLDIDRLKKENVKIWVAQWINKYNLDFSKPHKLIDGTYSDVWQYSCTYKINGVVFDTNVCYDDFYDYNNENSDLTVEGLKKYYKYTSTAVKPKFDVYSDGTLLKKNKDYKVYYFNNVNSGVAKAKIVRFDNEGNYLETKTVRYIIGPKPVTFTNSITKKHKVEFSWNEGNNADYYEVYYYDSLLGKYTLLEETEDNHTSLNCLDSNTTYKFKVRCVKFENENILLYSKFTKITCKTN